MQLHLHRLREWITGVETIKRQTWAAYGCLIIGQSPVAVGLAYGHYVRPLSVTQQQRCSCRLRRYISVMPLP